MQDNAVTAHLLIFVDGVRKGTHILPPPIEGRTITHEYQSTKDGGASMITSNLPKDLLHQLQQVFNQYFVDVKAKEKSVDEKVSEHLERLTEFRDKQIEILNLQKEEDKILDRTGFLIEWKREVDELKAEMQNIQNTRRLPSPGFVGAALHVHERSTAHAALRDLLKQLEQKFFVAEHLYQKLTHSHINIRLVYTDIKDQWIFLNNVKSLRDVMLYVRSKSTTSHWSDDVKQFKLFLTHKF